MFFVEWEQKYVISCISNLSISIITKPVTELRHYRGVGLQKREENGRLYQNRDVRFLPIRRLEKLLSNPLSKVGIIRFLACFEGVEH